MKALVFAFMLITGAGGFNFVTNTIDDNRIKEEALEQYAEDLKQSTEHSRLLEREKQILIDSLETLKMKIVFHPLDEVDKAYTTRPFRPFGMIHPITGKMKRHLGTDFGHNNKYVKVRASLAGKVISVNYHKSSGWAVTIDHGKYLTKYFHLRYDPKRTTGGTTAIKRGYMIKQGEYFAIMGNTGASKGTHLHWELHKFDETINEYVPTCAKAENIFFIDNQTTAEAVATN